MNKVFSVLLAIVVLTLAALPVAAGPPGPVDYQITQYGSCWLPDSSTWPVMFAANKQTFHWVTPIRLVAYCRGQLPKGSELPKETLEVTYATSDRMCLIKMGPLTLSTTDYMATVSPNGSTAITCRVELD